MAPGIFSEQTLIPFERVVVSVIIIINKNKLKKGEQGSTKSSGRLKLLTEWSDVLERLWNFSEWELSKVSHNWFFRELHELFLCLHSTKMKNRVSLRFVSLFEKKVFGRFH